MARFEIIAEKLGIEEAEVTLESDFKDDLDADSLDVVDIVMSIEEEFDVTIGPEDEENIKTVGSIVEYIENNQ